MERLSLSSLLRGDPKDRKEQRGHPPEQRKHRTVPDAVVGRSEEIRDETGVHPARVSVDEADGRILTRQMLKRESVHRCGVVDHVDDGEVVLKQQVVCPDRTLLAACEDAEDARGGGLSKQR